MKSKIKPFYIKEILVLFAVSLIPLLWLGPGEVVMGHDSGFRLNFLSYYKSLLFAVNPVVNFGIDWQLYKGFLMTQLPEFLGTLLTGSWATGQRAVMVWWFFAMQLGMYVFAKNLFSQKRYWFFRVFASLFYGMNFFVLQGWFIVERAKFSLYAALPLALLILFRIFEQKKSIVRNAIFFGLLYFVASGGGSPPLYGATLVLLGVSIVFFSVRRIYEEGLSGVWFSFRATAFLFLAFTIINAYWIVPQLGLYGSTYSQAVAQRGGVEGLIAWERVNSRYASIGNLMRLEGIPDWYDNPSHPFSSAFISNPILVAASWLPFTILIAGILFSIRKKRLVGRPIILLMFLLLGIGLLFAGGSHPPFGFFYEQAMRKIPGFAIFRSSFYKFGPLVFFSIIFLTAYFLSHFLENIKERRLALLLKVLSLLFILLYHYPFFTKNIFQFHKDFTTRLHVPVYVEELASLANKKTEENSRILVLPELTSSFYNIQMDAYDWGFFSLDILPRNTIDRSIVANDNNAPEAVFRLYSELADGKPETFQKLAGILGVRYLLWRDDAKYSPTVVSGRTIAYQRLRMESVNKELLASAGRWELYDFGKEGTFPLVWSPASVVVSAKKVKNPLDLLLMRNVENEAILEGNVRNPTIFQADCVTCELDSLAKQISEIPLPMLRYKPGTLLFAWLLKKEQQAQEKATSPEDVFNTSISRAQTRLAWMASVRNENTDTLAHQYGDAMDAAGRQLERLTGRQKNYYTIRLILYLGVSRRFLASADIPSETKKILEDEISTLEALVRPKVWMTESPDNIRYEFEVDDEGIFDMVISNVRVPVEVLEIDGKQLSTFSNITLSVGYHTMRIQNPQVATGYGPHVFFLRSGMTTAMTPPELTFNKRNPTKYIVSITNAQKPYVLVLNDFFDPRWKVKIRGTGQTLSEKVHFLVNGFANGWSIDATGNYELEIYYSPQRLFTLGVLLSAAGLVTAALVFFRK